MTSGVVEAMAAGARLKSLAGCSLRVAWACRSASEACALREWRWVAMLRRWRGRARDFLDMEAQIEPSLMRELMVRAASGGAVDCRERWSCAEQRFEEGDGARPTGAVGFDWAAMRARRWWRRGCGRRRLEWLRRIERWEGREGDRLGRWAVEKVLDVRRPAQRKGQQLDALLKWAGADGLTGEAWPPMWKTIVDLTADLRDEARRLERRKWPPPPPAVRPAATRKCARLHPTPAQE